MVLRDRHIDMVQRLVKEDVFCVASNQVSRSADRIRCEPTRMADKSRCRIHHPLEPI